MIKSTMRYCDVLFPINLGPLTYRCPDRLSESAVEGMLVSAPLKNRLSKGILLGRTSPPPKGPIKELAEIHGNTPALSPNILKLLKWISDYYIAPEGLVLKQTVPSEIFSKTKARRSRKNSIQGPALDLIDIEQNAISPVLDSISAHRYQTFIVQSPSLPYEYSLAMSLLHITRNIIILFPEISQAGRFFSAARKIFEERVCMLHSRMPKGQRSEYIVDITSGRRDIIIGTRAALFAPLKAVSLIIVLHEHNSIYKAEDGIRYHSRDVAVMRGFLEKATVVLSSTTPSIDSCFNAFSGKYVLVKPPPVSRRPRIQIVDMRFEKKVRPGIAKTVMDSARNALKNGRNIMLVMNRRGYSTLLSCRECGHAEHCPVCNIPLVMHKDDRTLKCHYCGKNLALPDRCSRCGSFDLELLGSGTQRVQEDIENLFGTETLRFDSDMAKSPSDIRELMKTVSGEPIQIIIGTKMMTKRIKGHRKFSLVAILNIDASLNFPDFRASEKAYRELSGVIDLVEPDGEILVQTRFPQNPLFRYFRENAYPSFVHHELRTRKELRYPPFEKLILIRFRGGPDTAEKIMQCLHGTGKNIEVLGPTIGRDKKGMEEQTILLKSGNRQVLNKTARAVLEEFRTRKDIDIRIDVDPA